MSRWINDTGKSEFEFKTSVWMEKFIAQTFFLYFFFEIPVKQLIFPSVSSVLVVMEQMIAC